MTPAIMEDIWDKSNVKGSPRLLLLAIAKHANHDGTNAYPSLATLEHLTQLSHSQVCLILRQLVKDGHLRIEHGAGPKGTNAYTILRSWETRARPKIAHADITRAKIAHARARPKIGPNQEPKRKKGRGGSSDVLSSDIRTSDPISASAPVPSHPSTPRIPLDPKAPHLLSLYELSPKFTQVCKGEEEEPPIEETSAEIHPEQGEVTTGNPVLRRAPETAPTFHAAVYYLGALCPTHPERHEYGTTGKSVRYLEGDTCKGCALAVKQDRQRAASAAKARSHRLAPGG